MYAANERVGWPSIRAGKDASASITSYALLRRNFDRVTIGITYDKRLPEFEFLYVIRNDPRRYKSCPRVS